MHVTRFGQTLATLLETRPKPSDKEALELRKKEKLLAKQAEASESLPRKLLAFEQFKDEILEDL